VWSVRESVDRVQGQSTVLVSALSALQRVAGGWSGTRWVASELGGRGRDGPRREWWRWSRRVVESVQRVLVSVLVQREWLGRDEWPSPPWSSRLAASSLSLVATRFHLAPLPQRCLTQTRARPTRPPQFVDSAHPPRPATLSSPRRPRTTSLPSPRPPRLALGRNHVRTARVRLRGRRGPRRRPPLLERLGRQPHRGHPHRRPHRSREPPHSLSRTPRSLCAPVPTSSTL